MTRAFNRLHGTNLEPHELEEYDQDYLDRVMLLAQALEPKKG